MNKHDWRSTVTDLLFVLATAAFFAVAALYTHACGRL